MARMTMVLPDEVIDQFNEVYENADKIFGDMTKAGAEVVLSNIKANVPPSFKDSNIMHNLYLTKTYKTPSDGGINTKVGFYGYFVNKQGKTVPAPLVANVFEYGSSKVVKQPYLRQSFRKNQIEQAMLQAQKKASGGLLE